MPEKTSATQCQRVLQRLINRNTITVSNRYGEECRVAEYSLWKQAQNQAEQIKTLKDKGSKCRQIVLLCETWKKALGVAK